jgi:hypothetical protein
MKTRVDAEAFVRCARKVEALGVAQAQGGAPPTADVLARAALLSAHLHDNFLTLCSSTEGGGLGPGPTAFADADAFCDALRGVRFVPSHAASALAGPHEGEPVLAWLGLGLGLGLAKG